MLEFIHIRLWAYNYIINNVLYIYIDKFFLQIIWIFQILFVILHIDKINYKPLIHYEL